MLSDLILSQIEEATEKLEKQMDKKLGDPENPFNQVGHNEIFKGPDGRYWLSCHGIGEDGIPKLVIDPLEFDMDGNIFSNGPTYTKQVISY